MPRRISKIGLCWLGLSGATLTVKNEELLVVETTNATTPFDCTSLKDIVVDAKDYTTVVKIACQFWPTSFGPFPATYTSEVSEILDVVLKDGGLWNRLQKEISADQAKPSYCKRGTVVRDQIEDPTYECPPIVNETVREEMLTSGQPELETIFKTAYMAKRPVGCDLVHQGVCYDACPWGHRASLKGSMRLVCTSICGDSLTPYSCGSGCAKSRWACFGQVAKKLSGVISFVADVTSFLLNRPAISQSVNAVIALSEFAVGSIAKILRGVKSLLTDVNRNGIELGIVVTLFQFIKDQKAAIGADLQEVEKLFGDTMTIFTQITDSGLGWKDMNIQWVSDILLANGADIVDSAAELVRVFAKSTCPMPDPTTVFAVESCGLDRMVGPWMLKDTHDGKPRYRHVEDSEVILEWNKDGATWGFWEKRTKSGIGRWFGWAGFGWTEVYYSRDDTPTFTTTGWKATKSGKKLVPYVVRIEDGAGPAESAPIPEDNGDSLGPDDEEEL